MQILFEDQDILVLHKPAGVVVNDAVSASGTTLQQWVRSERPNLGANTEWQSLVPAGLSEEYGSPEQIFSQRSGMVHRLDKDTSGVVIWAKNPGAQVELLRQFRDREVTKEYVCLVHGRLAEPAGSITAPIERSTQNRQRFAVRVGGRPAETEFRLQQTYLLDFNRFLAAARQRGLFAGRPAAQLQQQLADYLDYSLVSCHPKTGRTHQIRVHMQHLSHPLAGDQLYQGRKRIKMDAVWCPRHFLHAASITLRHPRTGQPISFSAPLPGDLSAVLAWLTPESSP